MPKIHLILLGLFSLILIQCKPHNRLGRFESPDLNAELSAQLSSIILPVELPLRTLGNTLNKELTDVLYEGKIDDYYVRIEKALPIKLSMEDSFIFHHLTANIMAEENYWITNIKARGQLKINFKTQLSISPDWSVASNTELIAYDWTDKPKIEVGPFQFPIKKMANQALEASKRLLTNSIDQYIRNELPLKNQVLSTWNQIQRPILLDEKEQYWLALNPRGIQMSSFQISDDKLQTHLIIPAMPEVFIGQNPKKVNFTNLPKLKFSNFSAQEKQIVHFPFTLPFQSIEKLAQRQILNKTYYHKGKQLKVAAVHCQEKKGLLNILLTIEGDLNGQLDLLGTPYYSLEEQHIFIDDIRFRLRTKNLIHKTLAGFYKKYLKAEIKNASIIPLKDRFAQLEKEVNRMLDANPIYEDLLFKGQFSPFFFSNFTINEKGIQVILSSETIFVLQN